MKNKISFNNGFITAITLFLEHKNYSEHIIRDNNKDRTVRCDLRLYGATDHLYDMEIPEVFDCKLRNRIIKWRDKCFYYRLEHFRNTEITDECFEEAEHILAKIDMEVFHTKKVVMNYR